MTEIDAFVTLEVYGVTSCGDYPNGSDTFSDLFITANGKQVTPRWVAETGSLAPPYRLSTHSASSSSSFSSQRHSSYNTLMACRARLQRVGQDRVAVDSDHQLLAKREPRAQARPVVGWPSRWRLVDLAAPSIAWPSRHLFVRSLRPMNDMIIFTSNTTTNCFCLRLEGKLAVIEATIMASALSLSSQ